MITLSRYDAIDIYKAIRETLPCHAATLREKIETDLRQQLARQMYSMVDSLSYSEIVMGATDSNIYDTSIDKNGVIECWCAVDEFNSTMILTGCLDSGLL